MREGLYDLVKNDSVKEGDGNRMLRNLKFDMVQYFQNNHTHYKDLEFRYIAEHNALLTPRLSVAILHNKTINFHGLPGKNIPKDLFMEFLNRKAKDGLTRLGPDMTSATVTREGNSLGVLGDILSSFDRDISLYTAIGKHTVPDLKGEVEQLVDELKMEDPFKIIPGRCYTTFPTQSRLHTIDGRKLTGWMLKQK
ncbi:Hypp6892 [Branchiostoma lanceolatum]|uniref:Hypp6892 protein n=1 Tax=Branchiostoma lanceolatum TaxID=7740 RepID=A0A8K0EBA3_BRALA|nr:Hypp6892 [Branchiostoma lanceolatum]